MRCTLNAFFKREPAKEGTPKGFRLKAQDWEERATLGNVGEGFPTPMELRPCEEATLKNYKIRIGEAARVD
jgi:hypothetical protein